MRFLIVEDQDMLRGVIVLTVDTLFPQSTIHQSATVKDAQTLLSSSGKPYDLIICDYDLLDGFGSQVYEHIRKSLGLKTPFLFQTSHPVERLVEMMTFNETELGNGYLKKPYTPSTLKKKIREMLGIVQAPAVTPEIPKYIAIRTPFFLHYNTSLVDVFVKEDEIYSRVISANMNYASSDITHLIEAGQSFLYVRQTDYDNFGKDAIHFDFLTSDLAPSKNFRESWESHYEVARGLLQSYGISSSVFENSKMALDSVASHMNNLPSVTLQLISEQLHGGKYLSDHSLMVAILSTALVKGLAWDLKTLREKFVVAALFHDLTLTNQVAMIDLYPDKLVTLSRADQKTYHDHPQKVAHFLSYSLSFSKDSENIILEHHERPDGTGFPRRLDASHIHSLSAVFIVAHEIIKEMYLSNFDPNAIGHIVRKVTSTHYQGNFAQLAKILPKIFEIGHETNA